MITTSAYPNVVRSTHHMEVDPASLERFQNTVAADISSLDTRIAVLENDGFKSRLESIAVLKMLDWIGQNYPEAIEALDATIRVTTTLDKSNADAQA